MQEFSAIHYFTYFVHPNPDPGQDQIFKKSKTSGLVNIPNSAFKCLLKNHASL